jgi:hypothetical protein
MQLTSSTSKALVLALACVEIASAKVYNCPGALNVNVVDDKTMGSCCIGSNDDSCDVTIPVTATNYDALVSSASSKYLNNINISNGGNGDNGGSDINISNGGNGGSGIYISNGGSGGAPGAPGAPASTEATTTSKSSQTTTTLSSQSTNPVSSSGSSARPAAASTAAFTTVTSSGGSTVTVTSSTKTGGAGKLDSGYAIGALALLAGAALLSGWS